jgi:hypothetical protein
MRVQHQRTFCESHCPCRITKLEDTPSDDEQQVRIGRRKSFSPVKLGKSLLPFPVICVGDAENHVRFAIVGIELHRLLGRLHHL